MAARNRSAGSHCGSGSCWAISTISWVRGASRRGAGAAVSHSDKLAESRILHLAFSNSATQVETGESHNSLAGFLSTSLTRWLSRDGSCRAQSQTWVSRSSFNRAAPRIVLVNNRRHYVADDGHRVPHRADPAFLSGVGRRRHDFSHGFAEGRDPDGFFSLSNACGLSESSPSWLQS